jgi:hypothetical protein
MKLKIHAPLELLPLGHPVDLLVPFVGISNPEFSEGRILANTYSTYNKNAAGYFEFTSIEECDVALLPIRYQILDPEFKKSIQPFIDSTVAKGKKVLIFLETFIEEYDIHLDNAIIFTRAISKSKQQKNAYSFPLFFEDYITFYRSGELTLTDKGLKPVVGFCGYAPPLGIKFGKAKIIGLLKLAANYAGIMRFFPNKSSHSTRARVLWHLLRSKRVDANFRIKQVFAFGPKGALNTGNTKETDEEFRRNFVNNIVESDYTVGVRGVRNTSIRFFETICCGRIPLFINTDCVLPFDFMIDWRSLCPWVEDGNIGNTDKILAEFHHSISPEDFLERQKHMRHLWEEYMSPDGFFKNIRLFLEHQEKINPSEPDTI